MLMEGVGEIPQWIGKHSQLECNKGKRQQESEDVENVICWRVGGKVDKRLNFSNKGATWQRLVCQCIIYRILWKLLLIWDQGTSILNWRVGGKVDAMWQQHVVVVVVLRWLPGRIPRYRSEACCNASAYWNDGHMDIN